jgi:2,3-bisphosphoglycerate-dependent phosphoglycerate mutase
MNMAHTILSLFLLRHGLSEANMDKRVNARKPDYAIELAGSPEDPETHENGHAQAYESGRAFVEHILKRDGGVQKRRLRLLVSPYLRTQQTSDGFQRALDEAGFVYDRREAMELREISFGLYDGLEDHELAEIFPREHAHYQKHVDSAGELYAPMPMGESRIQVGDRVKSGTFGTILRDAAQRDMSVLKEALAIRADPLSHGPIQDFVIVSHGVTIRQFRHRWMHYPWQWVEAEPNPGNCSIQVIENTDGEGYRDWNLFEGFRHVRGHEKQEEREEGHVLPDVHMSADEVNDEADVQAELEAYKPGEPMSPGLLARMLAETDDDRLDDDMREGRSPGGLWCAWLRS